jgi:tRNA (mo5U34)-methyltransferase
MAQTRSHLQKALNVVVAATNEADRQRAGDALVHSLQAYLESNEVVDETPDVSVALEATRKSLLGRETPLTHLNDQAFEDLNNLLPWAAMTVDPGNGRVLGRPWSAAKRARVHALVESRQVAFDRAYPLKGRHVAEFGCFEGIHTLGLLLLGAGRVTAIDGRMENVLKTMARVWSYGLRCDTLLWDFEEAPSPLLPAQWDAVHHMGVLYHLSNPIGHLNDILPRTKDALILDTHVSDSEAEATQTYKVGGTEYRYRMKPEPNASSAPFAGLRDHAKYLVLEDLVSHIQSHGFADTRVVDDRMERNGRRVTIWAFR